MDSVKIISAVLEGDTLLRRGPISIRGGAFLLDGVYCDFAERGVHFDLERRGSNSAGVGAHLIPRGSTSTGGSRRTLASECSVGVRVYFKRTPPLDEMHPSYN